ncbi:MAG: hypothetical protein WCK09_13055 [Bacteroidota bacterium]
MTSPMISRRTAIVKRNASVPKPVVSSNPGDWKFVPLRGRFRVYSHLYNVPGLGAYHGN